jgi:hypothetical protein
MVIYVFFRPKKEFEPNCLCEIDVEEQGDVTFMLILEHLQLIENEILNCYYEIG